MADTSQAENASAAQVTSLLRTAEHIRELNEQLIDSAMAAGSRRLDAYERALTTLVELTERAGASQLDWVSALAKTHAEFIRDVTTTYATTVRVLLG